jgi:hypothetical protein
MTRFCYIFINEAVETESSSELAQAEKLLTCSRKVPSSNLGREFSVFSFRLICLSQMTRFLAEISAGVTLIYKHTNRTEPYWLIIEHANELDLCLVPQKKKQEILERTNGPHRKHCIQQLCYCCLCMRC